MAVMIYVITFLVSSVFFLYYFSRRKFNYWKKRNVPYVEPVSIFGNFKDFILLRTYSAEITKELCEQFPNAPYVGVFYGTDPALVIKDPELIKLITTKDFYYFNGREISEYTHKEVVTQNIFFTYGDRWRIFRQNLTPLFSSSKIKNMFSLIKQCTMELELLLKKEYNMSPTIETRELMTRFTIDVISLCAFGINSNVMGEDEKLNPFKAISKEILKVSTLNGIKICGRSLWPGLFYSLRLKLFSSEVSDFFNKLLLEVFQSRQYESTSRNDFVDLILSLRKNNYITGDRISNLKTGDNEKINMEVNDDMLASQCLAFFTGGFETSSNSLNFILYELAKHEEIQKRAIAEVDAYLLRHKDGIEYDVTYDLPYLDACIDETLRLYPLLGIITREVMEDYTLPDGLRLEKGLRIHIPVYYLHLNPSYFENPEEFDPERFFGEKKKDIQNYTYLPFGEGPRICIGMRFGKMLLLAGLVTILKNYSVVMADNTPKKLKFEPKAIVTQPAEKIWLTFVPRNT